MARFFDGYVGMNDPQLAALAVMTWALVWLVRRQRNGRAVEPALLLMVLAGFYKHNLLAVPLTALCWLAAVEGRGARRDQDQETRRPGDQELRLPSTIRSSHGRLVWLFSRLRRGPCAAAVSAGAVAFGLALCGLDLWQRLLRSASFAAALQPVAGPGQPGPAAMDRPGAGGCHPLGTGQLA